MSVENNIIKVSFCGTFQKAVKPKRSRKRNEVAIKDGSKHTYAVHGQEKYPRISKSELKTSA